MCEVYRGYSVSSSNKTTKNMLYDKIHFKGSSDLEHVSGSDWDSPSSCIGPNLGWDLLLTRVSPNLAQLTQSVSQSVSHSLSHSELKATFHC